MEVERMKEGERVLSFAGTTMLSSSSSLRCLAISHFLLFFFFFSADEIMCVPDSNYTNNRRVETLKLARIERRLDKINKPAVRTIESPDGDIIDCVPRHKQPALDHPLLKNHKIQKAAPQRPRFKGDRTPINYNASDATRRAWQAWHHVGHCPKGTVPIRRSSVDDVLRAKSLFHFGKKHLGGVPLARKVDAPDVASGNGHEHAIAYTMNTEEVYGAKATINVWDPSIQVENEFSLSQIWILSGSFDGTDLNSIEAGWQVSPELYGDSRPRLFTYWTSDAYQATGCYNLLCSGFIQTNNRIAIGAAISPVSSSGSSQYDITILIWKDPIAGNWWMSLGDSSLLVGYWPAALFTHLSDRATMVEWGGEVVNTRTHGEHTSTQMGSGRFAEEGFGRASYFRNLEVVDSDNSLTSARAIATMAENSKCYDIKSFSNADWGTYFYYGGPGNNQHCP
ncbi:protein neprosin-like isoform X1 [Musa acuminata AAA Group]|uniref:protein neprosin-like isoform X1 n=1 Tax=Musa acuminata AAA Group TaxID=214697 RepID=UPI0031E4034A